MTWRFGNRSKRELATCHQDLQTLFRAAIAHEDCPTDLSIIEGHRGEQRQNELHEKGASQLRWPSSKHNTQPSEAVDVAPYIGGISFDWAYYHPLAAHIKSVWSELKRAELVSGELEWGGDWQSFQDGPHWQLNV